jgi:hypothetical protein
MNRGNLVHHGDTAKKREKQKQEALPCFSPCRRVAVANVFPARPA